MRGCRRAKRRREIHMAESVGEVADGEIDERVSF